MSWLRVISISAAIAGSLACGPAYGQFGGGRGRFGGGGFGGSSIPPSPPPAPTSDSYFNDNQPADLRPVQVAAEYFNQPLMNVEQRRAIQLKLLRRVNCQCVDTPLNEVLPRLQSQAGIEIRLNERALEDVGLSPDVPVTFNLKHVRLRTVLDLMLRELELTYQFSEDRLMVTTPEDAESDLHAVYYPCDDLLDRIEPNGLDYDSLMQGVTCNVEPESWEELGGPGALQPVDGGLVVSQIDTIHEKLEYLLAALRRAKGLPSENYDPTVIELGNQRFERERIDQAFAVPWPELTLNRRPLSELAEILSERTGVQILIDNRALEDVGLSPNAEVTNSWQNASTAVVLKDVLTQLDLTGEYRDEVYVITTLEAAESELKIKLYPVRDFLQPISGRPMKAEQFYYAGFDSLIDAITMVVEPESWEELGGPGALQPYAASDVLIISQTDEIHKKLDDLLREIRAGRFKGIPEPLESASTAGGRYGGYHGGHYAALPESQEVVDRTHRLEWNVDSQQLTQVVGELQQHIAAGSWDGQQKYIRTLGTNQIIVRNSPYVQRQIRDELQRRAASEGNEEISPAVNARHWRGGGGGFFQPTASQGVDPFNPPARDPNANPFGPPADSSQSHPLKGGTDDDPFGASPSDPSADPFGSSSSDPFGGPG